MNRHLLLACLSFALVVAPAISSAAGPVYKCVIQGTLTFQSTPCPTGESAAAEHRAAQCRAAAPRFRSGAVGASLTTWRRRAIGRAHAGAGARRP